MGMGIAQDFVSNDDASKHDAAIASLVAISVFIWVSFKGQYSYAMTFSLCIFYAPIATFVTKKFILMFQKQLQAEKQ